MTFEPSIVIYIAWVCRPCEVGGTDIEKKDEEVRCWNCEGPVAVTARMPKAKPIP